MNNQNKGQFTLNEGIDLELKPLKQLRKRIKDFKQEQEDDLMNQYKNKGKVD